MTSAPKWGDDLDDSDDEQQQQQFRSNKTSSSTGLGIQIPPTQKSRIDSKGIQIVTSYRLNPNHPGQLLKTITKVKVMFEKVKEPLAVADRRAWKKFGQAAIDDKDSVKTTTQSKDEIHIEDPNADTDLQEEDATATFGNLNAFWAKQQKRQLMRKYDVADGPEDAADGGPSWTQVGAGGATASSAGGTTSGRYVPPSLRGGMASAAASGGTGVSAGFQPERRVDDLNTIRVTNLSESTAESDLQELFQKYGRISRVYLAKDKETLLSRGFAFVSFVSKDDAARAMEELQGYGYDHLILKLEWARPNAPKDPASSGTEFRSGYGKALAQDTKEKVSFASNLTK
jgi:translation initiation factor 3 subunit G